MTQTVTLVAALLLGAAFGWAATAKAVRFAHWRVALAGYRLPSHIERMSAWGVPLAEASVVVLLLAGPPRAGAAAAVALLASFSLVIVRTRTLGSGDKLPCGCFGTTEVRDYRLLLVRNAALGALAAVVLVAKDRTSLMQQLRVQGGDALPMLLVVIAGLLITWMVISIRTSFKSGGRP